MSRTHQIALRDRTGPNGINSQPMDCEPSWNGFRITMDQSFIADELVRGICIAPTLCGP
ncbi:transferase transferring acyl groups [Zea mays]|jgi:hypothetical protein|uniref:Transferase transferring acyl groups n=1 Tax=Zea mays TaxID=4577 RepID=A0A1D6K4G0_MAIZE|nr:transferase transferring acyl groups [Zea mays]